MSETDTMIHIDKSVLETIRRVAKEQKRTLKATIEIIVEQYLKNEEKEIPF